MAEIACGLCNQAQAGVFCLCQQNPSFLCNTCVQNHCMKFAAGVHDFCPLRDFDYMQQISVQLYKKKKLAIAQSMVLAEVLEQQEARNYEEVKATLNQLFQQSLQLADSLHGALTTTLASIKGHLQQSLYVEASPSVIEYFLAYGQALQDSKVALFDVPVLSTILSQRETLQSTMESFAAYDFMDYVHSRLRDSRTIIQATKSEEEGKYCPVLMGNILRKYYLGDGSRLGLTELAFTPKVDQESGYAFLETGQLFVCGGLEGTRDAFLIGVDNSQVTILPRMAQGRSCPGVICFRDSPYVFGGSNGQNLLTACEKFAALEKWETLTEQMFRPRGAFTPCLFNNIIYLPGGFSTNTIEEFDPVLSSFRTLPMVLPGDGKAISFVIDTSLCIIFRSVVYAVDLTKEQRELRKGRSLSLSEAWSPITPIVNGHKAIFWCFEDRSVMSIWRSFTGKRHGICYSFNADNSELKEEERFEYIIS